MSYQNPLGRYAIAISISESSDMPALGLSDQHLRDAMAEIARHMLALGANLVYGGDLRQCGFSELLFELVARHRRDADENDDRIGVKMCIRDRSELERYGNDPQGYLDKIESEMQLIKPGRTA